MGDVGELARINVESWQHSYRGVVPDALLDRMLPESYLNGWRRWVGLPDPDAVFVAEDEEGNIGAYCAVATARDDSDVHEDLRTGELVAIYADPACLGTGAGRAVHDAGLAHLARQGFRYVVLWVLKDNWLTRMFYAHHGWSPDGAEKDHLLRDEPLPVVRYSKFLNAPRRNTPPSGGSRFPALG